jgi:O-antigen/teichoic acid export membrane protein
MRDKQKDTALVTARESIRFSILLLPFAAMSAGASSEITRLIFGPEFAASGPILAWLISGAILHILVSVNIAILIAAKRVKLTLLLIVSLIPLVLLGYMWLIPVFGPTGASMVTAGFYLLAAISSSLAVRATWALATPWLTLVRSLALSILAFAIAYWWSTTGLLLVLKLSVICAGIPLIYYIIGELTKRDLGFVLPALRSTTQHDSEHTSNTKNGEGAD